MNRKYLVGFFVIAVGVNSVLIANLVVANRREDSANLRRAEAQEEKASDVAILPQQSVFQSAGGGYILALDERYELVYNDRDSDRVLSSHDLIYAKGGRNNPKVLAMFITIGSGYLSEKVTSLGGYEKTDFSTSEGFKGEDYNNGSAVVCFVYSRDGSKVLIAEIPNTDLWIDYQVDFYSIVDSVKFN